MRLIDADAKVHISIYNGQYEEYTDEEMSIADILDSYSDEGCPDEVERKKGKWIKRGKIFQCSECEKFSITQDNYCSNCGSQNEVTE